MLHENLYQFKGGGLLHWEDLLDTIVTSSCGFPATINNTLRVPEPSFPPTNKFGVLQYIGSI